MNPRAARSAKPDRLQRGAATLVVVMILFFIMAMMAAFANRNLIFEQRIASNYYRSGVALEAAEAGADWALGMLNGVNVDQACKPTGDTATSTTSFRQRYLSLVPGTRLITPTSVTPAGAQPLPSASCVRVAGQAGWTCQCPNSAWTDATVADAAQMQPSFALWFQSSGRAGVVRIVSSGCTGSKSAQCGIGGQQAANNALLGASVVRIEAALVSALKMPPAMPLTVKGDVLSGASSLGLHNADTRSSGLLLLTGGTVPALDRLDSLPGTPPQQAMVNDAALSDLAADRMFQMFFGMSPDQYRNQPAMRTVTCPPADCSATLVNAYNQGVRMAWIAGPLTLASNVDLGTADKPMILVAGGDVVMTGPMRVFGLLYARGNVAWNNGSGMLALLSGAMISEGNFTATGTVDLSYQAPIIDALSNGLGSFVRVPGSWSDVGSL